MADETLPVAELADPSEQIQTRAAPHIEGDEWLVRERLNEELWRVEALLIRLQEHKKVADKRLEEAGARVTSLALTPAPSSGITLSDVLGYLFFGFWWSVIFSTFRRMSDWRSSLSARSAAALEDAAEEGRTAQAIALGLKGELGKLRVRAFFLKLLVRSKGTLPGMVNSVGPLALAGFGLLAAGLVSLFVFFFSPFTGAVVAGAGVIGAYHLWRGFFRPLERTMREFPIFPPDPDALPGTVAYPFVCLLVFAFAALPLAGVGWCFADRFRSNARESAAPVRPPALAAVSPVGRAPEPAPVGASSAPDEPPRDAGGRLGAPVDATWREFVDAGGRFRCFTPPQCLPAQAESAVRSKITLQLGKASVWVGVGNTGWGVPTQASVEQDVAALRQEMRRPTRDVTVLWGRLAKVDECPAADIAVRVSTPGQTVTTRSVKFRKHGYGHVLVMADSVGAFEESSSLFERFLRSYQSIDPHEKGKPTREKALPPSLDSTLGPPGPPAQERPGLGEPTDNDAKRAEFVDAGDRFRCWVPPGWQPEQSESATRSKVCLKLGSATLTIIVRRTDVPSLDPQEGVEGMAEEVRQRLAKLGTTLTYQHKRMGQQDGSISADFAAIATSPSGSYRIRVIKYKKHGYDHVLTLTTPVGSFEQLNRVFDDFLQSYRSIDPARRAEKGGEKPLPPALELEIGK